MANRKYPHIKERERYNAKHPRGSKKGGKRRRD